MAYLHCHSCDWSQDDFYNKNYNLWTKLVDEFKWLWKPRVMDLENEIVDDLIQYTHIPIIKLKKSKCRTWFLSWNWLFLEIIKNLLVYRDTKWKTHEDWKRHRKVAHCPKCGDRNFDID